MSTRISETLSGILQIFKSGQIPEAISYAAFPSFDIPSEQWSYLNRIITWMNNTNDARGYRQWLEAGRHVKKGAQAFHIFAPRFKKEKNEEGEEDFSLMGYLQVPVFRYEDTEGEPLNYSKTKIGSFHLLDRAKEWGLDVHAVSENGKFWGSYDGGSYIKLATPEESVFFHELAHHAHKLVLGKLESGQNWKQEIVAELSAEALTRILGLERETTGNSYRYIEGYAAQAGLTPVAACLQVLGDTGKVLKLILQDEKLESKMAG
ncbi:MAG: antirestriction protein [Deltaproteobacteria bacterium HGW-Deltaproteobacteria-13]|nr:MAG: antirestriction protein [Deltaproteobacteria bacterium HGW-Deltaproteobacteria-13]